MQDKNHQGLPAINIITAVRMTIVVPEWKKKEWNQFSLLLFFFFSFSCAHKPLQHFSEKALRWLKPLFRWVPQVEDKSAFWEQWSSGM